VDSVITHPYEYNFILQSHAGIQGTSRPAIYHVIYDEIQADPDILQQFCYNLCFLSQRATRSISFVAPSYRAHIAATCKQKFLLIIDGRMFLTGEGSDMQSNYSGSTDTPAKLVNVTDYITKTMYYM
jgi:eukaryotic translation initiation factor 2C